MEAVNQKWIRSGGTLFRSGAWLKSSCAVPSSWLPSSFGIYSRKQFVLEISRKRYGSFCRKVPKSFPVKAELSDVEGTVAFPSFCAASATDSRSSPFLQDFSTLDTRMRGIEDVIGNARSLDYALESIGEEEHTAWGGESSLDWKTDERLGRSCEAGTRLRVAVLLSGGVDSSVALRLLCNAGHFCTAFYLKIWFQEDFDNFWSSCPWEEDLSFAQDVCNEAGVELKVVHLTDAYWAQVVSESILAIQSGRTPNPDMLCNSRIKFGAFLEHVKAEEFDRIASGHYACVKRVASNGDEEMTQLHLSADEAKDQTYFLSQLSQSQLSRLMFPLGGLTKGEVREVAMSMGLSNKQRKDSQGICFLGKVKFREFIARHLGEKEGCLLEAETGDLLGTHQGFWFYTVGQRQGIGLSNGPWFVVAKDVEHNVVFISRNYFNEKKRRSFRVGSFNWASGSPPSTLVNMHCKVRHGPKFYDCTMNFDTPDLRETNGVASTELVGQSCLTAVVKLCQDDQGLAPGQYAAFYQGSVCLGSGIIFETLGEDNSMNVSVQALEKAKVCNNLEGLRDCKGAKNRGRRALTKDGAAVTNDSAPGSVDEISMGSILTLAPVQDVNESISSSQTMGLRPEQKRIRQTDSGEMLSRACYSRFQSCKGIRRICLHCNDSVSRDIYLHISGYLMTPEHRKGRGWTSIYGKPYVLP